MDNFNSNQNQIMCCAQVGSLFERSQGIPALLVGAGPSLNKNLPWVIGAQDRAMIFCADTILKALVEEGVNPTAVLTLDSQPDIARLFDGVDTKNYILVATTIIHPSALEAWNGEIVFDHNFAPDIPQLTGVAK